ncbi:MAG TPA: HAMP domain-containing sensor histidine kinase [Vicinamibacterales bacterium]|nr:HAMP domain-containing sensor histidine kinase [Vicinamibacterales bacterium]
MTWSTRIPPTRLRFVLASAIGLSALALVWIGYRAVVEWRHAAGLVASRRASSAADLLVSALSHDMRGAHTLVLAGAGRDGVAGSSADLMHPVAGAFTRYPYAEAFFSWRSGVDDEVVFYTRAERRPSWLSGTVTTALYPVTTGSDRRVGRQLLERLEVDAQQGRRFSAFTTRIAGRAYQVAATITYGDPRRETPEAFVGYVVNMEWVRAHYFQDLAAQVSAIEGSDHSVRFTILDDRGAVIVGSPAPLAAGTPVAQRLFPVAFFDTAAVAVDPPPDLGLVWWAAVATAKDDPTLGAAERGARRTLALAAVMTLTLGVGLGVSLRAARANADLASMRADFVSAVTHELKTPLANIRAINETLASGRATPEMIREYAGMSIDEATRLTRLVDNLLAYSRVTDVADVYSFEPVSVAAVVRRSLQEFGGNLRRDRFEVQVDFPDDLPLVKGDPNALGLLFNNLIDNAIRYSKDQRSLTIGGRVVAGAVTVDVSDRGIGIPHDEVQRVTRKFFRGRGSMSGGSGLGLAIVDRIVTDHGGSLAIRSAEGQGTTVSVTIPAAPT